MYTLQNESYFRDLFKLNDVLGCLQHEHSHYSNTQANTIWNFLTKFALPFSEICLQ